MNIEKLICTELEFDGKRYKIYGAKFEEDKIILSTEEIKEEKAGEVKEAKEEKATKKYELSEMSKAYFKNVHPYLVDVISAAITDSPYDFKLTAGARTAQEQNALYQLGRTRAGNKVTNCDGYKSKSNHQIKADGYGYAVDIFICGKYDENGNYVKYNTQEGYDFKKLKAVADHIKKIAKDKNIKVEWGGDWKGGWDSPHFELKL